MALIATEQRLVPATIRQEGMIVGSDGHLYAPQTEPQGRSAVTAILLRDAGLDDATVAALVPKILATVNLMGPKLCTCLHVEGGTDPAHGHGYYQCETCGGLCCSERWCGHEVSGLRWMELMMQHHRHSQVVVRGLKFVHERLDRLVEWIAASVPPAHQKAAMHQALTQELGNLSHIWFQSVMGDYLYQTGEQRGGPTTARIYEEPAGVLAEKLAALKGGITPEAFIEKFGHKDHLSPEEALARVEVTERKRREAQTEPAALPEAEERDTFEFSVKREKVTVDRA